MSSVYVLLSYVFKILYLIRGQLHTIHVVTILLRLGLHDSNVFGITKVLGLVLCVIGIHDHMISILVGSVVYLMRPIYPQHVDRTIGWHVQRISIAGVCALFIGP